MVNGLNRGGVFWGLARNFVLLTMGDFMVGIDEGDGDGLEVLWGCLGGCLLAGGGSATRGRW